MLQSCDLNDFSMVTRNIVRTLYPATLLRKKKALRQTEGFVDMLNFCNPTLVRNGFGSSQKIKRILCSGVGSFFFHVQVSVALPIYSLDHATHFVCQRCSLHFLLEICQYFALRPTCVKHFLRTASLVRSRSFAARKRRRTCPMGSWNSPRPSRLSRRSTSSMAPCSAADHSGNISIILKYATDLVWGLTSGLRIIYN